MTGPRPALVGVGAVHRAVDRGLLDASSLTSF
jgi:hypothetical protein